MIEGYSIITLMLNFFALVIGIIAHFGKKKVTGQTLDDIKNYFKGHFKSTITTLCGAVVLFGTLVSTGGLGFMASFMAGYMADSALNKGSGTEEVKQMP